MQVLALAITTPPVAGQLMAAGESTLMVSGNEAAYTHERVESEALGPTGRKILNGLGNRKPFQH